MNACACIHARPTIFFDTLLALGFLTQYADALKLRDGRLMVFVGFCT